MSEKSQVCNLLHYFWAQISTVNMVNIFPKKTISQPQ